MSYANPVDLCVSEVPACRAGCGIHTGYAHGVQLPPETATRSGADPYTTTDLGRASSPTAASISARDAGATYQAQYQHSRSVADATLRGGRRRVVSGLIDRGRSSGIGQCIAGLGVHQ